MNTWDPDAYQRNAAYVPALGAAVFEMLGARPGERILDLGCGDGSLTEKIAATGAEVVGVDLSQEMIASARARGLNARIENAEALPFDSEFDAVFSNAVLHWVGNHDAMLKGVYRSLRPGGRFVAEFGGHGNIAAFQTAIRAVLQRLGAYPPTKRYYPTAEEYRTRLGAQGFEVEQIVLIPRPTPLQTGIRAWLSTFERSTIDRLADVDREPFLRGVEELLAPELCDGEGRWTADHVRLRFKAVR